MNTNIPVNYSTDFTFNSSFKNISWQERGLRFCLAFPFVFQELLNPLLWHFEMVMLGLYLAFTALVEWDPVYHVLLMLRKRLSIRGLLEKLSKTFKQILSPTFRLN